MKGHGLDYEVWFRHGEFDRRRVAVFWLYHDARAYIEGKENKDLFTLVDKEAGNTETVKDW